MPYLFVK